MSFFKYLWHGQSISMNLYRVAILIFAVFSLFDLLINYNSYNELFNGQFLKGTNSIDEIGQWNIKKAINFKYIFHFQIIGLIISYLLIIFNKWFRTLSFISWFLLLSLLYINPIALNQFDYLRVAFNLFILIIGSPTKEKNKFIILTFNLFICSIYLLQYLNRPIDDWLGSGTTVFYILSNINNWTPLSSFILNSLEIHKIISYSIFIIELIIPMFIFLYYGRYRNKILVFAIVHHLITYFLINNRPEQLLMICFLLPMFLGNEKLKIKSTIYSNSVAIVFLLLIASSFISDKSFKFTTFAKNAIGFKINLSFYRFKKEDHWYRIFAVTKENKHLDLLDQNEIDYFDNMIPANSSKFLTNGHWHRFLTRIDSENEQLIKIQHNIIKYYCSLNLYKEVSIIKISKKIRTDFSDKIDAIEKILLKRECLN